MAKLAEVSNSTEPRHLTSRELEIVRLVVNGLSNREIADRLTLSRRTVEAHVATALAKTETRTRTQLAVYALRIGHVALHPEKRSIEGGAGPQAVPGASHCPPGSARFRRARPRSRKPAPRSAGQEQGDRHE